jgi:hypothetical protein
VPISASSIVSHPVVRSTRFRLPPFSAFLVRAAVFVVLLEGIVDGERKARVHLLAQGGERLPEPALEVLLGLLFFAAEPLGRRGEFLSLRDQQRAEQIRIQIPDGAAEPDVEKVRERGVADVVVVGRIGGDQEVFDAVGAGGGVDLAGRAAGNT